jgi:hypothetical protein
MGTFAFGVLDFFSEVPKLVRNTNIKDAADIMAAIYNQSSRFKRGKPACRLYYVTTGRWIGDVNLEARRAAAIADLEATGLFGKVEFFPMGADGVHQLYREAKHAISREFRFDTRTVVPASSGVTDAYLGLIPAKELLTILQDEDGEIIKSLFYDNVRDWQYYNKVNAEIRDTLTSNDGRGRFALMNNGVTIIARNLQPTGNKFYIEDFQIVNGCQTSHVLFDNKDLLDESVMIPLRLIATQDEGVINSIIRATNRQTEVKDEQFFALTEFPKTLEAFFRTFPNGRRLYYERRSRQYDSLSVEKTRIITHANLVRAFAATFLEEPHATTRSAKSLKQKLGNEMFVKGHILESYYVAAFLLYKLEYFFRSQRIDAKYKPARFHILFAARLLASPVPLPKLNAREMEAYCKTIEEILWDSAKADELFFNAVAVVEVVAEGNFHRDNIRTQPFTEKVKLHCQATANDAREN